MSVLFWDADERGYSGEVYSPNPWDYLIIGKWQTPGVIEINGTAALAHTKSKPSGAHGARVTVTGKDPQEIDATLYLWTPDQWDKWQEIAAEICGSDKTTANPFDVSHPALASIGVRSVMVLSRSTPTRGRVVGEKAIRLRMVEWTPPPPTKSKAKKGAPAPATDTPPASVRETYAAGSESFSTPPDANLSLPSGESTTVGP